MQYYILCSFHICHTVCTFTICLLHMSYLITVLRSVCISFHVRASLCYILHIKYLACQTFYHLACNTFYMTALEHTNMPLVLHHSRHVCLSFTLQSNNEISEKQWFSKCVAAFGVIVAAFGFIVLFQRCIFSRNFAPKRQSDGWRIHIVPRRTRLDAPQRTGFPEQLPFGMGTASYEG